MFKVLRKIQTYNLLGQDVSVIMKCATELWGRSHTPCLEVFFVEFSIRLHLNCLCQKKNKNGVSKSKESSTKTNSEDQATSTQCIWCSYWGNGKELLAGAGRVLGRDCLTLQQEESGPLYNNPWPLSSTACWPGKTGLDQACCVDKGWRDVTDPTEKQFETQDCVLTSKQSTSRTGAV